MKRAADNMFEMFLVITVESHPGDLWVIGKNNWATLAPSAPTGRSQHVFKQCPL